MNEEDANKFDQIKKVVNLFVKEQNICAQNYHGNQGGIPGTICENCSNAIIAISKIREIIGKTEEYPDIKKIIEDLSRQLASGEKIEDLAPEFAKVQEAITIAISIASKERNFKVLGDMCHNLGCVYQLQKLYKNAVISYSKTLPFRQKAQDKKGEAFTLLMMAECYLKLGNRESAKSAAEKVLKISQEIDEPDIVKQLEKILRDLKK